MRFDERFIDELKARLRPSDVIGRTVKLKRQGREFVGLSPFTKEKSPSFFVNDDKGFFHDFSSGKHGDVISFLQETERLSFVEAVSRLAGEAGMQLPAEDPQAAEREQKRQSLSDWMDLAQKWFAANLRRTPGKAAREYLERRGLPEDQWERFGLGYAPNDREGLKQALIQRGLREAYVVDGRGIIRARGERSYQFWYEQPTAQDFDRSRAEGLVLIEDWPNNEFRALLPLAPLADRYLYVTRDVDGSLLGLLDDTRATVGEYQELERTRSRVLAEFSLLYLGFALLLVAAAIWWLFRRFGNGRVAASPTRWFWAIQLALVTHPLLDAFTVYGTQLLWPFAPPPAMWSSVRSRLSLASRAYLLSGKRVTSASNASSASRVICWSRATSEICS